MLRDPTSRVRAVCTIWGTYCAAARSVPVTPRKAAHRFTSNREEGPKVSSGLCS